MLHACMLVYSPSLSLHYFWSLDCMSTLFVLATFRCAERALPNIIILAQQQPSHQTLISAWQERESSELSRRSGGVVAQEERGETDPAEAWMLNLATHQVQNMKN